MNIRKLSVEEIKAILMEMDEKPFRAKQIHEWLWQKCVSSFDEMTNLSKNLREKFKTSYAILPLSVGDKQVSDDGTIKCAFELHDNKVVEGVLIPTEKRMTACISSQVGCSLTCAFCATGKLKRMRKFGAIRNS